MERIGDMESEIKTQPARPRALDEASDSRPARPPAIIRTENLSKQFGDDVVVDDLTFEVPPGVIFGFIGPSGSGKTTTIRLLNGIYAPTAGSVEVFGQAPRKFTAATRERIGYMPQNFVLYPTLSVWENISFSASLYGMGFGRGARLKELLEFVELYEHRGKLARSISGGMQRRLALAATLAHDPELIYLDEPTAGIDPVLRRKFWDFFGDLKKSGHTVFVTTQYVGEAANCDLVGVLVEGRVLMVETPDGLRRRALGGEVIDFHAARPLDYRVVSEIRRMPFVVGAVQPLSESGLRITVDDAGTAVPDLLEWAGNQGIEVKVAERYDPPLDDVFVELVGREQNGT
jgi:ABC-2 type transport system ATP-binding protein